MQLIDQAVKDIALERPGAIAIFRRRRIDFCCNGGQSLRAAADGRGLDPEVIAAELAASTDVVEPPPKGPAALIDLILARFHQVHRQELPELLRLAARVDAAHHAHPDRPAGLGEFLADLSDELIEHMSKEEMILFPLLLEAGPGADASMAFMTMRFEHLDHAERLAQLAMLTNGFQPPADACPTWRALYAGCAKLDGDLREHIHLENNVLFPLFEGEPATGVAS